jgi:hypothetical protein
LFFQTDCDRKEVKKMTVEVPVKNPEEDTENNRPPTCTELLARLPDIPHHSDGVSVEPKASALSSYKPRRSEKKEKKEQDNKSQDKKEEKP